MAPKYSRIDTAYDSAVKLVIEKKYSLRDAVAKVKNGISKSTLARRVKEAKGEISRGKAGRRPALSIEQEQMLARVCLKFASQGVPITREELAFLVQRNYGTSLRQRFPEGKPGRRWTRNFCKRNNLSFNKPKRQTLLSRPLPKSSDDLHTIVSEEGLAEMVNEERSKMKSGQGSQGSVILKRGSVDTT